MDSILQRIDDKEADLIALTQDLIRFPTINPPGEAYEPCAHYLGERLKKRGFDVQYVRAHGTPGDSDQYPRINIIARKKGGRPGPCVHFNSHIDVVEVGKGWTKDPFGGEIADGKIYGRGACDMKGGLAASIIAIEAYIEANPDFPGAIEISGTCDEESGGYGGVAYLAEQGFFAKDRVDHVIIPEPLNKDRICLGHRGVWWAEIETHGHIAHGSMPFLGDCAVRHMGAVIDQFEEKLYPALAEKRTDMPVVPPGARQSTLNINSIHGGQSEDYDGLPAPCVPDSCRMVIDRRFLIEEQLDQVKGEITKLLDELSENRDKFRYEIKDLFEVQPTMTDKEQPVVQAVSSAISDVLETQPDYVISPGTYDQKHIDRIGKLKDCIAYGPGILDLAHQPDEYVGIEDMLDSAKVMAKAIHNLLNGDQQ
ncbi:acetylornithine deacetylase/succinyl-diaminopimelate desuccinylase family protein [Cohaesibacter gelatinilyticus]|uniref:Succinyl-diaminopimelate desuccinylase n=1 Tax=Cohaesibacter gelatinilyticus TaxID=372072 RepID=A0A285PLL7_9HYPH|nr:acetylornithine deacetylase/succinyl-diaminopimelate desuccinylase family protein [Cohaesibacter gelatinilyticus]SNZ20751.1 succinyl-diaminopimelate desuccinylase [Cohaesibacter gelatinilyticus]